MATTRTTSTKAKSKTTKKPATKARAAAAKATTKSKSTKAVKPAAVKKAVAKAEAPKPVKAVKVKKVRKPAELTLKTLRKLHLVKAFVAVALAAVAGYFMTSASYALTVGYQAKDELISLTAGKTAFVNASQSVLDVELRWVVVAILGLSAVFSLLVATKKRKSYEAGVDAGVSKLRWIGSGIVTALMTETVALLAGISDLATLKLLAVLVLVAFGLAWVSEKRLKQAGHPIWSDFVVGNIVGAAVWLTIGSSVLMTWVYGLVRLPWYVYALVASVAVFSFLVAVVQYKNITGWKNYLAVERDYVVISLLSQVAFAVILIVAFLK